MTTVTTRGAVELEQQLAAAGERADWSPHLGRHCAGVAAACRWLLGRTDITPATGVEQPADSVVHVSDTWAPDAVTLERMRAGQAEDAAARNLQDAAELHGIVYTLAWYLREAAAEVAPLP